MDWPKLRAWWAHRQGLLSREHCSSADVFERHGWSRSVGGVNPYLTLLARNGATPNEANKDLADLEILELPAVRGCTYVLPKKHFELGLLVAQAVGSGIKIASAERSLGITDDEIEALGVEVKKALKGGQLDPKALKDHVGDHVRSFGEEGKKKGVTTNLPTALGRLQARGEIVRVPTNGRLDTQRYAYKLWMDNPLVLSGDGEKEMLELARLFFKWIGPARVSEFAAFSALGVAASKKVAADLGLVALEGDLMLLPEDVDAFHSFSIPKEPSIRLVGSPDGMLLLRRQAAELVDESDSDKEVYTENKIRVAGGLMDFSTNVILDRGRVVGMWEFDHPGQSIAYQCWHPETQQIRTEVATLEAVIRDELEDARTFSLDSPQSRSPKIAFLRREAVTA